MLELAPVCARSPPPPEFVLGAAAGEVVDADGVGDASAVAVTVLSEGAGVVVSAAGGVDASAGVDSEAEGDGDGEDDSVVEQSFLPPFQDAISLSLMTGWSGPAGRSPCSKPSFASLFPSNFVAPRYRSICAKQPASGTAMSRESVWPCLTVTESKSTKICRPEVAKDEPWAR